MARNELGKLGPPEREEGSIPYSSARKKMRWTRKNSPKK